MRRVVLAAMLLPGVAAAQPAPAIQGNEAESRTMVRAAGMPLSDGALAPGMLTVRVVEGAFTRDLAGQAVEVRVTGVKSERAVTGADGRAQFAHLPVGVEVRALSVVGEERLESEAFVMPAESGVRLLLVAGSDGAGSAAPPSPETSGFVVAAPQPVAAPLVESPREPERAVRAIGVGLALTTVFVFALFMMPRRRRRS